MMESRAVHSIKDRLSSNQIVRVISMGTFPSPKLIETAARIGGFHGVWIDQEHSAIPHAQMELLLMACRASGLDAFARVAPTDYATVMRPMEAGCSGVMAAQIRTVDETRQLVQWAKYPPEGVRGLFLSNAEAGYGTIPPAEHVRRCNADRWIAVQIETSEAVEAVDQIAAIDGVDLLFVGPGDLACNLGVTGESLHPKCVAALEGVAAACKNHGKVWGTLTRDPAHAEKCRELGCMLFSIASDMDLIHRGFEATKTIFDGLGFDGNES